MKKMNPEYEKAHYVQTWKWYGVPTELATITEVRTNNPNYVRDGRKESDRIPKFIEIDT